MTHPHLSRRRIRHARLPLILLAALALLGGRTATALLMTATMSYYRAGSVR
jgi:hypothetical protein